LFSIALLASCGKGDPLHNSDRMAGGYSILVNNGDILISGFETQNDQVDTKYWLNGEPANKVTFEQAVENKSMYRKAVDELSRKVYTFKDTEGSIQNYQFDQGSISN